MKLNLKPIRKDQVITKGCEFLNWTERNAPSIETYSGLGFIFGGTLWACKRTLNMPSILEELAVNVEGIREDYAAWPGPHSGDARKADYVPQCRF